MALGLQLQGDVHLVATREVTVGPPRWASTGRPAVVPAEARAIAIGLERTTVILVEQRDDGRSQPGDVLRGRHLGLVRMLSADGQVLARRRLVHAEHAHADAVVAHLLDEVRAAVVAAPHLVVGLVQDAGIGTWEAMRSGLARLTGEGLITGWCEAIDRGALRARLARTLCVVEADALAREDLLDHWDACLDAWDDAIDGVAGFLRSHRDAASEPRVVDAQLGFLASHRDRMRYAALRGAGLHLRPAAAPPLAWPRRLARGTGGASTLSPARSIEDAARSAQDAAQRRLVDVAARQDDRDGLPGEPVA
ncbi:MAG: hypothetical protein H6709_03855 [Kofleriaceae bacterium]|nr:hypothetical protein [Kofleriaceae bacterium]MCB9571205.1 hypothetical protein [Kofleriaceae bacterium]